MVCALIKIGPEHSAPHPHNCQLLKHGDRYIVLMQSANGWTNKNLTTAFLKLQLEHPDVPLGPDKDGKARPKVVNFDGHSAHIYNDDAKELFEENDILALSPPSHTTAPSQRLPGTQQADALARDGGGVARFKKVYRPKMYKQFRFSMHRKERRGQVSVAEIMAMAEDSLEISWDPDLAEHLNETVGYFINEDGYLDYDVLRNYRAADGSCSIAREGSGETSGEAGGASSYTPLTSPHIPLHPLTGAPRGAASGGNAARKRTLREIQLEKQRSVEAALDKAAKQLKAAGVALDKQHEPAVPQPGLPVGRARKDAPNRFGCVVSKSSSDKETELQEKTAVDKENKAANKQDKIWDKWRPEVKASEAALTQAGMSPGEMLKKDSAGVARLKGLVVSRTGKLPKAKNNKPTEPGAEGALLKEARRAAAEQEETLMPPTPERRTLPFTVAMEEEEEGGTEGDEEDKDAGGALTSPYTPPYIPLHLPFHPGTGGLVLPLTPPYIPLLPLTPLDTPYTPLQAARKAHRRRAMTKTRCASARGARTR